MAKSNKCISRSIIWIGIIILGFYHTSIAQNKTQYVRIVNIIVDSAHLETFKVALKKDIETAVRAEPGTLTLHAVYDKDNPTHITVFEIYASKEAHQAHQQTKNFLEYRNKIKDMVKSTTRFEMIPIALESKSLTSKKEK